MEVIDSLAPGPEEPPPPRLRPKEKRLLWGTSIAAALALVAFSALAVTGASFWTTGSETAATPTATPTPLDIPLYAAPDSNAAKAAASDPRFAELAAIPQAKWLSSWSTVETAYDDASRYLQAADAAGEVPVLVLYQIPDRDCGLYAQGGLATDQEYLTWVDEIARALNGHSNAIVIIEPDALPMAGDCRDETARVAQLGDVVSSLAPTGARVYLDAGHSGWWGPELMAQRLFDAGVGTIAGFSTNVSNFRSTADEVAYAEAIRARLAELGVADAHYVIDTSRNGADVPSGEVCNPPEARVGARPQLFTGTALDAYLWVKAPGEPDGPCNGAPAGVYFWPEGALQLMGQN